MKNEFKFNEKEGIIYLAYVGNQTYETVSSLGPWVEETAKILREKGKPVLVLGDTRKMKYQDSGSRKAGIEIMTKINVDKYALVVTSTYLRVISSFITKAIGFGKRVKHFSRVEDAVSWLKS